MVFDLLTYDCACLQSQATTSDLVEWSLAPYRWCSPRSSFHPRNSTSLFALHRVAKDLEMEDMYGFIANVGMVGRTDCLNSSDFVFYESLGPDCWFVLGLSLTGETDVS